LRSRLDDNVDADHFVMARRANETNGFQTVARLLVDASIFMLPSYFPEGLANAMLEATTAGTAPILSNVGGDRRCFRAQQGDHLAAL
jgi:glycosyltransferase involved in cell wall biosynthesis